MTVGEERRLPKLSRPVRRQRRPAKPVRGCQVGRNPLLDRTVAMGPAQQRNLGMNVHVDEPRTNNPPSGVDDSLSSCPLHPADRNDAVIDNPDIGQPGWLAPRPVDNYPAANPHVEVHRSYLPS